MEEMYGEQNQRSYSAGVSDFGSRSASASAGFVKALTKSVRNCPGCCEYSCANESGTRMALSSVSPVVAIPVITSVRAAFDDLLGVTWIVFPMENASGLRAASAAPTIS